MVNSCRKGKIVVCTSSYLSVEMLKLVDKVIYLHEGETVYFGRPFKTHSFLSRVLGTNLKSESNPICTLSNLFNSRIERKGEL